MRTGSLYDVVEVLKSLRTSASQEPLVPREGACSTRARFLVVSEISEVTSDAATSWRTKVNKALEKCFAA